MASPLRREFELVVMVGLLAGVLAMKALYLPELLTLAAHDGSLTYTEGVNGILAARPDLLFHPFDRAPYFPTIYPLLYHGLVNHVARRSTGSVFQAMHLLSLTASLLTGVIIVYWLRDRDVRTSIALLAAGLYVLSPTVTGGTVLGRVDHFGIFLGMAAVYIATRRDRGAPIESGILTVCLLFVKQALIAFPITIAAYYWLNGWRRDATAYTATTVLFGGGAFLWLVGVTDGRAFYHLVTLNGAQVLLPHYAAGLGLWTAFIHVGLVAIALNWFRWDAREFAPLFLAVAVATGLLLSAKPGAWTGYYLPAILAAALYAGLLLDRVVERWDTALGILVLGILVVQFGIYGVWQPAPEYPPDAQNAVVAELEDIDGPILTVDNGLLVRLNREHQPHEQQLIRTLPEHYRPPGGLLIEEIRDQHFAAIVLARGLDAEPDSTRWTRAQLAAMNDSYRLHARHGPYRVFVPATA